MYIYIYQYLKHGFDKGMRELNKYKKKLLKVKSEVEVLAHKYSSQVKLTPCFLCQTYSF